MTAGIHIIRSLLVYGLCLPLAVVLGYYLATPLDRTTFGMVGGVFVLLLTPFLLRSYQAALVLTWNASAVIFFLPGQPTLFLLMTATGAVIAVVQHALNRELQFVHVPSVTWPLIFLGVVILATALLTGGFGFAVFGSQVMNSKKYVMLLGGIIGYFVLTSRPIPPERAMLYTGMFYLGALSYAVGDLAPYVGQKLIYIFLLFPVTQGISSDFIGETQATVTRFVGLGLCSGSVLGFLYARYGIAGIFDVRRPWRLLLFLGFLILGMFGGFRSGLIAIIMMFAVQFYMEGLFRTRLLPIFVLLTVLGGACLIPLASQLPAPLQRAISFLPVEIDPVIRLDAEVTSEWRWMLWKTVAPEVPRYLWLGKGYAMSQSQLGMAGFDVASGFEQSYYTSYLAGNYHSGPLSVIVPFGIWGAIGFLWFLFAAVRVMYFNYKYGDARLRLINITLLANILASSIMFFTIFGDFSSGLVSFIGLTGLSVALNGGVCKPVQAPIPAVSEPLEIPRLGSRLLPRH